LLFQRIVEEAGETVNAVDVGGRWWTLVDVDGRNDEVVMALYQL